MCDGHGWLACRLPDMTHSPSHARSAASKAQMLEASPAEAGGHGLRGPCGSSGASCAGAGSRDLGPRRKSTVLPPMRPRRKRACRGRCGVGVAGRGSDITGSALAVPHGALLLGRRQRGGGVAGAARRPRAQALARRPDGRHRRAMAHAGAEPRPAPPPASSSRDSEREMRAGHPEVGYCLPSGVTSDRTNAIRYRGEREPEDKRERERERARGVTRIGRRPARREMDWLVGEFLSRRLLQGRAAEPGLAVAPGADRGVAAMAGASGTGGRDGGAGM